MFSKIKNKTWLKYFLSYFLIIATLLTGFLFIAKVQFESTYNENLHVAAKEQIYTIKESIDSELLTLVKIHNYLESNVDYTFWRHTGASLNRMQLTKWMNEYTTTNRLLSSINIINLSSGETLSSASGIVIFNRNGYFEIYYEGVYIPFYPEQFQESKNEHRILFLEKEDKEIVVYLPKISNTEYIVLYVLDIAELCDIMTPASNSGIVSVCLLDKDDHIIAGYCPEILQSYIGQLPLAQDDDYYSINSNEKIFTSSISLDSCSLATVISNEEIVSHVREAMANTYLLLMMVSAVGFFLMIYAMQVTFTPLHKLVQNFFPSIPTENSYTELLKSTYTEMTTENQKLHHKLDSYRIFMQKSILSSLIADQIDFTSDKINLDHIFENNILHYIMLVKILDCNENSEVLAHVQDDMQSNLPGHEFVEITVLEQKQPYAVFMLCYMYKMPEDSEFTAYFERMHAVSGLRIAVSKMTESPLEIPSLYTDVVMALDIFADSPVIMCEKVNRRVLEGNNLQYPFENLDEFRSDLRLLRFDKACIELQQILDQCDWVAQKDEYFAEFFVRCVLIDILTTLANVINEMNIKFENYENNYFEVLYMCRAGSYAENRVEIQNGIMEILHLYEEYSEEVTISTSVIREVMERQYHSPDFSIIELTEILHVSSVPYMSLLFKKKFGMTFSDYLWIMRLDKAKDLLTHTDMNIEQISVSVGYINVSSFRRKFKQEMGITPSQYRLLYASAADCSKEQKL